MKLLGTSAEAAAELGVCGKTLARWRELEREGAPAAPCLQPGGPRGPIRWRLAELSSWAERLSAWQRRRHLRLVAEERPAIPTTKPRRRSLLERASARTGRG